MGPPSGDFSFPETIGAVGAFGTGPKKSPRNSFFLCGHECRNNDSTNEEVNKEGGLKRLSAKEEMTKKKMRGEGGRTFPDRLAGAFQSPSLRRVCGQRETTRRMVTGSVPGFFQLWGWCGSK